jgi:hypothetical protein
MAQEMANIFEIICGRGYCTRPDEPVQPNGGEVRFKLDFRVME